MCDHQCTPSAKQHAFSHETARAFLVLPNRFSTQTVTLHHSCNERSDPKKRKSKYFCEGISSTRFFFLELLLSQISARFDGQVVIFRRSEVNEYDVSFDHLNWSFIV